MKNSLFLIFRLKLVDKSEQLRVSIRLKHGKKYMIMSKIWLIGPLESEVVGRLASGKFDVVALVTEPVVLVIRDFVLDGEVPDGFFGLDGLVVFFEVYYFEFDWLVFG